MKSIQSKNNTPGNYHSTSFFQKESGNNFFGKAEPTKAFFNVNPVQAKLTIGQPNDIYEKEADEMADKVVQRLSDNDSVQAKPLTSNSMPALVQTKCSACEHEEQLQAKPDSSTQIITTNIESGLNSSKGSGSPLPTTTRTQMESSFGTDFSNVRIHNDSSSVQMNKDLNAQAFTHGGDIYFNSGKYDANSNSGKHLLAHELTHVVQQKDEIRRKDILQRNLAESIQTPNGVFGIDMQTQTFAVNSRTGMTGSIDFLPGQTSPYSNEISLIQIGRVINADTGAVVPPVGVVGATGTNVLSTQDNPLTGVEGGFNTDVVHNQAGTFQDMPLSPRFRFGTLSFPGAGQCFGNTPQIIGFKRSNDPADIHEAKLADCPAIQNNTSNFDFSLETVAKGTDTNFVYGSLKWGFKARAGTVIDERALVSANQSATFDEALTRHQDFYTHEPIVFYFDFDHDDLNVTERAKLDNEVSDHLKRFPDVRLSISAFADRRGSVDYNRGLANRRADTVAQLFLRSGLAADRINPFDIEGRTERFTADAITDQDKDANRRGNRRVMVTFEHTATVPLPGQI